MSISLSKIYELSTTLTRLISAPYGSISDYVNSFADEFHIPIRVRVTKFSRIASIRYHEDRPNIGSLLSFCWEEDDTLEKIKIAEVILDSEKSETEQIYGLLLAFGRLLTDDDLEAPSARNQYYPIYLQYKIDNAGYRPNNAEDRSVAFALFSIFRNKTVLDILLKRKTITSIAKAYRLPEHAIRTRIILGIHITATNSNLGEKQKFISPTATTDNVKDLQKHQ